MHRSYFRYRIAFFASRMWALLFFFGAVQSHAQSLTDMRDWTSTDGKMIRAELLTFSPRQAPGTARFRVKDGTVFTLPTSRFSKNDQAIILKEQLNSKFRVEFSKRQDSCFFYAKNLAEDDWDNRTWAYIGSDIDRSWLRLAIYSEPGFFSNGNTLIIVGNGAPLKIEYAESDIDSENGPRNRYEGIDTLITDQAEDFFRVIADSSRLEIFAEESDGTLKSIPLSGEEIEGLRATSRAFHHIAPLSDDHTWWATLINRAPDELRTQLSDPLLAWRDPQIEAELDFKTWTHYNGETLEAEFLGFERDQAVLRDTEGNLIPWQTTGFQHDDLALLADLRLESSLTPSWHPIEDHHQFHWANTFDDAYRFDGTQLLFAIDKRDLNPRLVIQHLFEGDPKIIPLTIELPLPDTTTFLSLPLNQPLKMRTPSGVVVWELLPDHQINSLYELLADAEFMEVRGHSSGGESDTRKLSGKSFSSVLEAIEIYRMFSDLLKTPPSESSLPQPPEKTSPEAAAESETSPESAATSPALRESEVVPPVEEIFSAIGE